MHQLANANKKLSGRIFAEIVSKVHRDTKSMMLAE